MSTLSFLVPDAVMGMASSANSCCLVCRGHTRALSQDGEASYSQFTVDTSTAHQNHGVDLGTRKYSTSTQYFGIEYSRVEDNMIQIFSYFSCYSLVMPK